MPIFVWKSLFRTHLFALAGAWKRSAPSGLAYQMRPLLSLFTRNEDSVAPKWQTLARLSPRAVRIRCALLAGQKGSGSHVFHDNNKAKFKVAYLLTGLLVFCMFIYDQASCHCLLQKSNLLFTLSLLVITSNKTRDDEVIVPYSGVYAACGRRKRTVWVWIKETRA